MLHTGGLPARAARAAAVVDAAGPAGGLRPMAAELGAGHVVRVPPDVGALGAVRASSTRVTGHDYRDVVAAQRHDAGRAAAGARPRSRGAGRHRPARHRRGTGHTGGDQGGVRRRQPARHRGHPRGAARVQRPGQRRHRRARRGRRHAGLRPRPVLPGAVAQPGRDVEARRRSPMPRRWCATASPNGGPASRPTAASACCWPATTATATSAAWAAPSRRGAFGHNGAGGQLAWADPATGLSLGYCTNGLDQHVVREPRRGTAISSLAGVCAAD